MKRKTSIYTIAEEAGVSTATVSKIINNQGYVSEEVSRRVLEIIKKYNYVPSQKKHSSNAIGVVVFYPDNIMTAPFTSQLLNGICSQTFTDGRELLIIDGKTLLGQSPEELYRYYASNSPCGLLAINLTADNPLCLALCQAGIPFILMANSADDDQTNFISSRNYEAAAELIDYIICLGHVNIAYIGLMTKQFVSHRDRFRGYTDTLARHGLQLRDEHIIDIPDAEPKTIENALRRLLGRNDPPSVIFINSESLETVYYLLQNMGYRVPEDISLAGLHVPDIFPDRLNLTSFIQPAEKIGRLGVVRLQELTAGKIKQVREFLPNTINYGNTVAKLPPR